MRRIHGAKRWLLVLAAIACHRESPRTPEPTRELAPDAPVVATLNEHGPPPGDPTLHRAAPAVIEYGPAGSAEGEGALWVRFSAPMQPTTIGSAALHITVDPPIAGAATWVDPYRFVYTFEELVPPARHVDVRVHGRPVTTDGTPIDVDLKWSFATEPPHVDIETRGDSWWDDPADDEGRPLQHWRVPFLVTTTPPVRPDELRQFVRVTATPRTGGSTTALKFRVRRPGEDEHEAWYPGHRLPRPRRGRAPKDSPYESDTLIVEPVGHWPADAIVSAQVSADFRTRFGPLTLGRAVAAEAVTLRGLGATIECETDHGDGCGEGEIWVSFDGPVSRRAAAAIRIDPKPPRFRAVIDDDWMYSPLVRLRGRFAEGRTYRVTVPTTVRDAWGQSPPAPIHFDAHFVPPPPEVTLSSRRGTLLASEPRTVGLETRWVSQVKMSAVVLRDEELLAQWLRDPDALSLPDDRSRIIERTIDITPQSELGWSSIAIDLADLSGGKRRPVLVQVEPTKMMPQADGRPQPEIVRGIWQQTDLGATAVVSPARSLVRVTSLGDGTPVKDVRVDLFRGTQTIAAPLVQELGATDRAGLVDMPRATALPKRTLVRLRSGDDRFVLRVGELRDPERPWRSRWSRQAYEEPYRLLHSVVTERPLYRPGERVRVVGWTAISDSKTPAGLRPLPAKTEVALRLVDREGEAVAQRVVRTTAHGKYFATLDLPPRASLGSYRLEAEIDGETSKRSITVKEFRAPAFMVGVTSRAADLVRGEMITTDVAADYYFGGAVPIRDVHPRARCSRRWFRPPGLEPDWVVARTDRDDLPWSVDATVTRAADEAAQGRARLQVETTVVPVGVPYACTVSVAVDDDSLEQVGGDTTVIVHPEHYLFARSPGHWLREGQKLRVPVRAVGFDGSRRAGVDVVVEIERDDVIETDSGWSTKRVAVKRCELRTRDTGDDPQCVVDPIRGAHRIIVRAKSDTAALGSVALATFVGARLRTRPRKAPARAPLELEVGPEEPKPGEDAEIQIRSTHATGHGLLVLSHGGLRHAEPFVLTDGAATIKVRVDESWVPAMSIRALLAAPRTSTQQARIDEASTEIKVDGAGRQLHVEVAPPPEAAPDSRIAIGIKLRDADGRPTAGHVALWAVDEAVLALMEPTWPDLVRDFTVHRGERAAVEHDYDLLRWPYRPRSDPYLWGGYGSGSGFGSGSGSSRGHSGRAGVVAGSTVSARERFETTPIFVGDVAVGPSGEAIVRGKLPENLTTFRITAIASAPLADHEGVGRFGIGEARTRVTVPLALRAIVPRVLRPGDKAQIAAMVDNREGPPGIAKITLSLHHDEGSTRSLRRIGPRTHKLPIEAGGQLRVPFQIAANEPGAAKVELAVELVPYDGTAATLRDAMRVDLPVTAERTLLRRSAVYGEIDGDDPVAIAVVPPSDALAGRLEIDANATLLGGLDDVARDLVQYPYGCVEQTASRLVPLVAIGQLAATHLSDAQDTSTFVAAGVTRLRSMQTPDGGFGYWPDATQSHPYASAYALWVLERVRSAGHPVPSTMLTRARDYLETRLQRWAEREATSLHDDVPMALAVHALAAGGRRPDAAIDRLREHFDTLPIFARGLIVLAIAEIDRDDPRLPPLVDAIAGAVDRQGAVAHVRRTAGRYYQFFDSGTRSDAIVLLALLAARPDHALVVPLVRGLAIERGGGLRNTQERAYGLMALADYARAYEPGDPSFVADLWIGALPTARARFHRLDAPTLHGEAPLVDLTEADPRVTLRREGEGRLYWRVGMTWTPRDPPRTPVAAGIAVQTALRDEFDRDLGLSPSIVAGRSLALDVTLTADAPLDYVAIDVPLPAGLEAIDPTLGRGRSATLLRGTHAWWIDHRELYPDRALLFADRLPADRTTHTIHLRAATPGEFTMPPAHAEAMYLPEIHGHDVARTIRIAPPP